MKILHIGNTAGIAAILADAQNRLGHEAKVLEISPSYLNYAYDYLHNYHTNGIARVAMMLKTVKLAREFDIVHAHGGLGFLSLDRISIKRILKKPLILHYHGTETRSDKGMRYQSLASAKIVSTPDLLKWHSNAVFIPNPCMRFDISDWPIGKPRLFHCPTNRNVKGTEGILKVVDNLQASGLEFDFELAEGMPHEECIRRMMKSHIVIDQVVSKQAEVSGVAGVVSLEAMSLGKIAIASLSDDYMKYYPGIPIVRAYPETLATILEDLISNWENARQIAKMGPHYVASHHTPEIVALKCLEIYESLLSNNETKESIANC